MNPVDPYTPVDMDVLFALGPGKPDGPQFMDDGTPEMQQRIQQIRRRYYEQCRAADEAFAAEHPGLSFPHLCNRPEIRRLLDNQEPGNLP